jgi:hypothetical protein
VNLIVVLVIFNEPDPGTLLMDIDVIVGSLNRDKEMQNIHVKAWIITNYCDLISLVKSDTVRYTLCTCVKMDSWLIMQYKSNESDINILNTTTSCIKKQEVLGRTNHLLSLDTTPTA